MLEARPARVDERVKQAVENLLANLPALARDLSSLTQRLDELEKRAAATAPAYAPCSTLRSASSSLAASTGLVR